MTSPKTVITRALEPTKECLRSRFSALNSFDTPTRRPKILMVMQLNWLSYRQELNPLEFMVFLTSINVVGCCNRPRCQRGIQEAMKSQQRHLMLLNSEFARNCLKNRIPEHFKDTTSQGPNSSSFEVFSWGIISTTSHVIVVVLVTEKTQDFYGLWWNCRSFYNLPLIQF